MNYKGKKYSSNRHIAELAKKHKVVFATNLIALFPLFLIQNFLYYLNDILGKTEELHTVLILVLGLCIFLTLNLYMTLRISLNSFVKMRASVYSLVLMLGISKKDFWKLILREYCLGTGIFVIIGSLVSQGLSMVIVACVFKDVISFNVKEIVNNFFIFSIPGILFFFIIILFTICIIYYKKRKLDVIILFEKMLHCDARLYKHPVLYTLKPVIGISLVFSSLFVLKKYSVGKMFIAMFLHVLGIFFILNTDGFIFNKFIRKFKKFYYKNIIKWSNVFYQYKVNAKVIFIIYVLNFLLTFIIGGLIVSDSSEKNVRYPYDVIVYGNEVNVKTEDSYRCITVEASSIGEITVISNSDYNKITESDAKVSKGKILYYREKTAEEFSAFDKDVLFIQNGKKYQKYDILEADWKILFGENIFPELNIIVVFNDEDFITLSECNEINTLIATNNKSVIKTIDTDEYNKVWSKSVQLEQEKISNTIINTIVYIIGLVFILESQSLVLIRQILDETKECDEYEILKELGIENKAIRKIQIGKIRNVLFFPEISAIIMGIFFFMCDYLYQTQQNIRWMTLFLYGIVILNFGLIQYIGYRIIISITYNYYKKYI